MLQHSAPNKWNVGLAKPRLRDASIATGVSVDKVLALQGQSPVGVQVAVVMPTEQERAERRVLHDRLDETARKAQPRRTPRI